MQKKSTNWRAKAQVTPGIGQATWPLWASRHGCMGEQWQQLQDAAWSSRKWIEVITRTFWTMAWVPNQGFWMSLWSHFVIPHYVQGGHPPDVSLIICKWMNVEAVDGINLAPALCTFNMLWLEHSMFDSSNPLIVAAKVLMLIWDGFFIFFRWEPCSQF